MIKVAGWTPKELATLRGCLVISACKLAWDIRFAGAGETTQEELLRLTMAIEKLAEV